MTQEWNAKRFDRIYLKGQKSIKELQKFIWVLFTRRWTSKVHLWPSLRNYELKCPYSTTVKKKKKKSRLHQGRILSLLFSNVHLEQCLAYSRCSTIIKHVTEINVTYKLLWKYTKWRHCCLAQSIVLSLAGIIYNYYLCFKDKTRLVPNSSPRAPIFHPDMLLFVKSLVSRNRQLHFLLENPIKQKQ